MMKTNKTFWLFTLLFVAFASHVQAATTLDFYTYNGFLPVSQAFQKAALIFANPDYLEILDAVMYISLPLAGIIYFLKAVSSPEKGGLQHAMWALPLLLLFALYLALFRTPDSTIVVYDPVLNRTVTVGNLPEGVVLLAGYLNRFERDMVEIIDTAGVPGRDYQGSAGGVGINLIRDVQKSAVKIDHHIQSTLAEYIDNCVIFELSRPGTTLDIEDIMRNTNDFLPLLDEAAAPSIFTKLYTDANPSGATTSCLVTNTAIANYFASPNFDDPVMLSSCTKNGFDVTNTAELTKCKSLISNSITNVLGFTGVSHQIFTKQAIIAEMFYKVLQEGKTTQGMSATANRSVTTSGVGMGIAANEWLPIIRAIMLSLSIGLIPFLVVFIPSPLGWKAISTIAGLMVFNSVWGVTDAICHGAAMDYSAQVYGHARMSGLAFETMLNFPDLNMKTVALFGQVRSGGIMLASVITMMLVKFGGAAMAQMAGGLVGGIQAGGKAGGTLATPEGHSGAISAQRKAIGTEKLHASPAFTLGSAASSDAKTQMEAIGTGTALPSMEAAGSHGEHKKALEVGDVAGKTLSNHNAGMSNHDASVLTGSVSQAGNVATAGARINNGGLDNVGDLATADAEASMGATEGAIFGASALGKGVQDNARDMSTVSSIQKGAGAEAQMNTPNLVERSIIDGSMTAAQSAANLAKFTNPENAAAFAEQAKTFDLNSTEGRLEGAKALQQSLADDGQSVSLAESQQILAKAQTLNMGGGVAAYMAKTEDGADNMISTGETNTRLQQGSAAQVLANVANQGGTVEAAGGQGAQLNRGVAVTEGIQSEMRTMNAEAGNRNAQIPSLGSSANISRGTDGKMTGYQATETGSGSTQSYDTDAVNNTATRNEITTGQDGQPIVSKMSGEYGATGPAMFNIMSGEITQANKFQGVSGSQSNITTSETEAVNRMGNTGVEIAKVSQNGDVLSTNNTTGSMSTTNWNAQRVNQGTVASGTLSGGADLLGSGIGRVTAIATGQDEETQQTWADRAGSWSSATLGNVQNGLSEASQLKGAANSFKGKGGLGDGGNRTTPSQSTMDDIHKYVERQNGNFD